MSFADYSQYYNLLYQDKDYQKEGHFVDTIIKKHSKKTHTLLDLGCGTGNHLAYFLQKKYQVTGVDRSRQMLAQARTTLGKASNIILIRNDITTLALKRRFDVIVSLFHVLSYQTTNSSLAQMMAVIAKHLKPKGIAIFDAWYGPAVFYDPPKVRIKRFENSRIAITRISEPNHLVNKNIVSLVYTLFIQNKKTLTITTISENHQMRYFFKPEIKMLLDRHGLKIVECREWLTGVKPTRNTFGVYWAVVHR